MGLESPIELWLASDNRSACLFQTRLASSHICDETAGDIPQKRTISCDQPMAWNGKPEHPCSWLERLDIKKDSGRWESVCLTSFLIEHPFL
jgi:hypothetical protein